MNQRAKIFVTVLLGISLISIAILIWFNQTGRISLFADTDKETVNINKDANGNEEYTANKLAAKNISINEEKNYIELSKTSGDSEDNTWTKLGSSEELFRYLFKEVIQPNSYYLVKNEETTAYSPGTKKYYRLGYNNINQPNPSVATINIYNSKDGNKWEPITNTYLSYQSYDDSALSNSIIGTMSGLISFSPNNIIKYSNEGLSPNIKRATANSISNYFPVISEVHRYDIDKDVIYGFENAKNGNIYFTKYSNSGTLTGQPTKISTNGLPYNSALAYDSENNTFYAFGGQDITISPSGLAINCKTNIPGIYYDSNELKTGYKDGQLVIPQEICNVSRKEYSSDIWKFKVGDTKWTKITDVKGSIPARAGASMVYNGDDKLIVYGGVNDTKNPDTANLNDTWQYDISDKKWTKIASDGPMDLVAADLTYNPNKNEILLTSGFKDTTKNIIGYYLVQESNDGTYKFTEGSASNYYSNGYYISTKQYPDFVKCDAGDTKCQVDQKAYKISRFSFHNASKNDKFTLSITNDNPSGSNPKWTSIKLSPNEGKDSFYADISDATSNISKLSAGPIFFKLELEKDGNSSPQIFNITTTFTKTDETPQKPDAPTDVTVVPTSDGNCHTLDVSWKQVADADHYNIYNADNPTQPIYTTDPDTDLPDDEGRIHWIASGLDGEKTYSYQVSAVGANGLESDLSQSASGATVKCPTGLPPAPTDLTATVNGETCATVTLAWKYSEENLANIDHFQVTATSNGTEVINENVGKNLSKTYPSLTAKATYEFSVKAVNANGSSDTVKTSATLPDCPVSDKPSAPINLKVDSTTQTTVNLSWEQADTTNVTGYNIYNADNNTLIGHSNTTNFIHSGLICNTKYRYYVKAHNTSGVESDESNKVEATTATCPATGIGAPNVTVTVIDKTTLEVHWDAVDTATGYDIYDCSGKYLVSTTNTSYTFSDLKCSTEYCYYVVAKNDKFRSENSNQAKGKTSDCDKTVTPTTANISKLVSTGGSLWFNLFIATAITLIIAYFIFRKDIHGQTSQNTPSQFN